MAFKTLPSRPCHPMASEIPDCFPRRQDTPLGSVCACENLLQKCRRNRGGTRDFVMANTETCAASGRFSRRSEMVAAATENDRASCSNQPHSSIKTEPRAAATELPKGMMMKPEETGEARFGVRKQPDLRKEYRPIGIGAVAAALSATGKDQNDTAQTGRNGGERRADNDGGRYRESFLAA